MKIFILITRGDSIGGAQIHVKDIALRLKKDNHEVIVGIGSEGSFSAMLTQHDINYIIIPGLQRKIHLFQDIRALIHLLRVFYQNKPDIITIHSSKAGILGRIAGKILKYPTTFTAHGWAFTEGKSSFQRLLYQWIEKIGARLSNKIITVSNYDKDLYSQYRIGSEEKVVCIQNGVPDSNKSVYNKSENIPPRIIMIARFQSPKNHNLLIRALYQLQDIPWELELIGEDGGLEKETRLLVKSLGLEKRVFFLGQRAEVGERLAQAELFVLTSSWEGLPLTIIEAMRERLPIIASDVGGIKELILHKETGYLIQSLDELVYCLKQLLLSPEQRVEMGERGRAYYLEQFTFERMYRETLAVYHEVTEIEYLEDIDSDKEVNSCR